MSNKMKINIIFFLAISIVVSLEAFQPQKKDFVSDYQYSLYRSWLNKTEADIQKSAGFSQAKIIKTFQINQQEVIVEYPWENHLITQQRQKLQVNFSVSAELDLKPYLHYAESFIYRLNSSDPQFARDLLSPEIELEYNQQKATAALEALWQKYHDQVIIPQPITIIAQERLGLQIPLEDEQLILWFATDIDLSQQIRALKSLETAAEISLEELQANESKLRNQAWITAEQAPEISSLRKPELSDELYDLPLADFVRRAYKIRQSKELLNNKISDVENFLQQQYPQVEISQIDDIYYLAKGKYKDFGGDIFVEFQQETDGILLLPFLDYRLQGKKMILPNNEELDLAALSREEVSQVAAAIPQLLYAHRALDSRLINFLMIHDDIPTTLIVHTEKRELYEVYSYANLLLMLSKYWQQEQIYFSLHEIKKVNGKIELVGYLIAKDGSKELYDMAEIWFRLDVDFRIDLVMMMLYPELSN